jgi:hypothetical protein
MTADDFVTAIDGLTFDENGRTWTLEVDDIDNTPPDAFVVTVCIPEIDGEIQFDASRNRLLDATTLRRHVIGMARDIVAGRQASGIRTCL